MICDLILTLKVLWVCTGIGCDIFYPSNRSFVIHAIQWCIIKTLSRMISVKEKKTVHLIFLAHICPFAIQIYYDMVIKDIESFQNIYIWNTFLIDY